ncbi:hypothetical protein NE237_001694 [Protea cynaroides]|uniref:Knl1 C-terminal RWD domain-containing protein n=1 Tax=Protea cynaroides TaxID=273540 RepID=A0A9Q0QYC0_9MAGN|nr:hypothetical protein NE237_001694 [Protea cynaroides]
MDPKEGEELCDTGPEEETIARQKNRSRRVSFAEITSVHVFDRDEEYETPPDSKPNSENSETGEANEGLGFQSDVGDNDDSKELSQNGEDDEDDNDDGRKPFLQYMDSSSPGSAIGSATSYDDENFFGPVSASFIRSGQPSDSAASDDNHDITLDSTAFSMHYRSLVQSVSGGDLKTPSGHHLTFEERTPSETYAPTNQSSFMALTGIKKPLPQCSVSDGKSSDGRESNDMSLVEENPHRYDYGRLSPTLGALLAEGSKDLPGVSVSNDTEISNSSNYLNRDGGFPMLDRHKTNFKDLKNSGSKELHNIIFNGMPIEVISDASFKSCERNVEPATPPIDQISHDDSSSTKYALRTDASVGDHSQTPGDSVKLQVMPLDRNRVNGRDALETSGLISEVGVCNSATSKPPSKTLKDIVITDRDYGFLGGPRALREEPTDDGSFTPKTLQNYDRQSGSPLAGSVSLLCAKRRQIFCDGTVSSGSKQLSTLFARKNHSSSLTNDRRRHGEIGSSIEKRISKFKILNTCATVEDGFDNLKPTVLGHNCQMASNATALDKNTENLKLKQVDISVTDLKGHLLCSAQKNSEQRDTVNMDAYGSETSKSISMPKGPKQAENYVCVMHDEECSEQISDSMLHCDQPSKVTAVVVSPFQFSSSGKQMQEDTLSSHNPVEASFITSDSLLIDITEDANANKQLTVTSELAASPEHIGILSRALKQQDQGSKLFSSSSGHVEDSGVIAVTHLTPGTKKNVSYLTPVAGGLRSLLKQKRSQSTSPIIDNNSRDNVVKLKGTGDNQLFHDQQNESGNIMDCRTPFQDKLIMNSVSYPMNIVKLKGMGDNQLYNDLQNESRNITDCKTPSQRNVALNSKSRSLVRNHRAGTELSKFKDKLSEEEPNESLYESVSPCVLEKATMEPFQKVLVDQIAQIPSLNEATNFLDNDRMQHCVGKDPVSPKFIKYSSGNNCSSSRQDLHILQQPLPVCDVENSGRKRKNEVILTDKFQVEETGKSQKSPKVFELNSNVPEFSSGLQNLRENKVDRNQADRVHTLSSDVFTKLYGAMKLLFSESNHELNFWQLGMLEDILGQLWKTKKYENLCAVIQFQKTHVHLGNYQQKRVAEARCLQLMLVKEQAKLQLMRVKREILQRRVWLLQSGIQECQNLKLYSLQHLFVPGVRGAENEGAYLTLSGNDKNEEACNKVITMKQEIGALDKKIKSIIECFHDFCHVKGEVSYDESVAIVNDHLKKRTCCGWISQDLQQWSVDDVGSESGHHIIALNYHNFLFQRLTISVRPISSIVTLNKLNDTSIIKAFPNINACTAFAFVFNAEATNKNGGPKCLAKETQITSSLLGNLLDVVEEVQAACIELPDLIQTSFHSPCVEQLNLRLCFIHFKTGMKVILILDTSCLNHGLYPSDVVPSLVSTDIHGVETPVSPSLSLSLSPEITVAVNRLKAGHARVIRLCSCKSYLFQVLTFKGVKGSLLVLVSTVPLSLCDLLARFPPLLHFWICFNSGILASFGIYI